MTLEEACRLIDPATDLDALAEVEYYHGFNGKNAAAAALREASQMVVDFVRRMKQHDVPAIDIDPQWVRVKDRLPEFEDDEPFVRCIVNIIRWSEGWTGLWNQPEPTLNEEEFTAAATYNPEQKIFTVYDGFGSSMVINALLSPDDGGGESGCRVTHWMENPAPVGFWKKEAKNDV